MLLAFELTKLCCIEELDLEQDEQGEEEGFQEPRQEAHHPSFSFLFSHKRHRLPVATLLVHRIFDFSASKGHEATTFAFFPRAS